MPQPSVLTITLNPSPDGKGHIPSVHGPIMNWPLCLEMLDLGKQCIMQEHTRLIKEGQRGIVAAPASALNELPEPGNLALSR